MSIDYSYAWNDVLGTGLLSGILSGIPTTLMGIAAYVLTLPNAGD